MSHPLVAAVWEQLGRRDVGNILREIIGEHAAELAVFQMQDDVSRIEPLIRPVLWINAIFDLQRAYLQGLTNVHDCHPYFLPYLLPSEAIFSTLMYLIRVKSDLFPSNTPAPPDFARHRHFIAQVLLGGIRLLLLRGDAIPPDLRFNLERAMRGAWHHPDLSGAESYLIMDLLPRAIDQIGSPELSKKQGALLISNNTSLPSFASGLYPFSIAPETLMTDLLTGIVANKTDHLTSFCTLFDIISAAEFALIQCHVDRRRISQEQGYSHVAASKVEEAFAQAQETRKKLVRTVMAAFDDEFSAPSLQVLATLILSHNAEGQPPLQTRRIRDSWTRLLRIRGVLEDSLGLLVRWLINRRVQMWDCNGELESISQDYQRHLTQWLQNASLPDPGARPQSGDKRTSILYAVDCPAVHMVPKALLEEQLTSRDTLYEHLQENPEFLTMNISCPLCPGDIRIQHARMIKPLGQVATALQDVPESKRNRRYSLADSASRDTTSQSSSTSHTTSLDPSEFSRSPVSPITRTLGFSDLMTKDSDTSVTELISPLSSNGSSDQLREKQGTRSLSRELKSVKIPFPSGASLFRKASTKQKLPRQPRSCFSTTGRTLLLWGAGTSWVMRFELSTAEGQRSKCHRYDVSGVQYAAAGDKRCAVIAAVGEHLELLIFDSTGTIADAYLTIETGLQNQSIPPICMTMSRNDRFLAFTIREEVRVYEVGVGAIRRVPLGEHFDQYPLLGEEQPSGAATVSRDGQYANHQPRLKALIERKIQFSVDAKHLVVATHLGDHCAYVDVWGWNAGQWIITPDKSRSFKLPSWTANDGDLTCVFYDSFHFAVIMTAFLGRESPLLVSLADPNIVSDPLSIKIVHAAQSPSGTRFVMANGAGEMYMCECKANTVLTPYPLKKASTKISLAAFKPGNLTLSFPQENEILAFWVKDGKLSLRAIRYSEGTETINDFDLRPDFDRLVVERVPAGNFPTQRRQNSSLSNQTVAEMEAMTPIRRPDMAELSAI
ncbi:hypothetical protein CFD26_104547 [Aspergillus turcosus]|uniref:Uncharacterized protein n=1 Tax=Aspergillus turcosus TaxID=1245748 RepID=A0A421CYK6_9EURO|nr:hypothetical protein CFD26_104547 [Aspergillus turcosus]